MAIRGDRPGDALQLKKMCARLLPTEMPRLMLHENKNGRREKLVANLTLEQKRMQDGTRRKHVD